MHNIKSISQKELYLLESELKEMVRHLVSIKYNKNSEYFQKIEKQIHPYLALFLGWTEKNTELRNRYFISDFLLNLALDTDRLDIESERKRFYNKYHCLISEDKNKVDRNNYEFC